MCRSYLSKLYSVCTLRPIVYANRYNGQYTAYLNLFLHCVCTTAVRRARGTARPAMFCAVFLLLPRKNPKSRDGDKLGQTPYLTYRISLYSRQEPLGHDAYTWHATV